MEISLENLFVDQGHRVLEERVGRRGGEGEFSGPDEVSLRPIYPQGFSVTKRKNKRDQDHGLLKGYGEPPKGKAPWGRG